MLITFNKSSKKDLCTSKDIQNIVIYDDFDADSSF